MHFSPELDSRPKRTNYRSLIPGARQDSAMGCVRNETFVHDATTLGTLAVFIPVHASSGPKPPCAHPMPDVLRDGMADATNSVRFCYRWESFLESPITVKYTCLGPGVYTSRITISSESSEVLSAKWHGGMCQQTQAIGSEANYSNQPSNWAAGQPYYRCTPLYAGMIGYLRFDERLII